VTRLWRRRAAHAPKAAQAVGWSSASTNAATATSRPFGVSHEYPRFCRDIWRRTRSVRSALRTAGGKVRTALTAVGETAPARRRGKRVLGAAHRQDPKTSSPPSPVNRAPPWASCIAGTMLWALVGYRSPQVLRRPWAMAPRKSSSWVRESRCQSSMCRWRSTFACHGSSSEASDRKQRVTGTGGGNPQRRAAEQAAASTSEESRPPEKATKQGLRWSAGSVANSSALQRSTSGRCWERGSGPAEPRATSGPVGPEVAPTGNPAMRSTRDRRPGRAQSGAGCGCGWAASDASCWAVKRSPRPLACCPSRCRCRPMSAGPRSRSPQPPGRYRRCAYGNLPWSRMHRPYPDFIRAVAPVQGLQPCPGPTAFVFTGLPAHVDEE
jgi:hypothetical protein